MNEKYKLWLGTALNALAWLYLALGIAAIAVAVSGRFAVRVPGYGFGLFDAVLLLFSLAVALGGFWLLKLVSNGLNPGK